MKYSILIVLLATIFTCAGAMAQREIHVSKNGDDSNSGTAAKPLKTISAAAKLALPGDKITVHEGTYREWVSPESGGTSDKHRITYQAALNERVEIKGSEVVRGWQKQPDGSWEVKLSDSFFQGYNPYKDLIYGDWFFPMKPLHTGQVFINGQPLQEHIGWTCQASAGQTIIRANFGQFDPNQEIAEITVRPSCFYPARTGINYITVRGFHMSQAATQWAAPTAEQVGLIGTNWSKGWIIADNIVSDSKCAGITLGKDRASGHNVWSANMEVDGAIHYNAMVKKVIAAGWNKQHIGSHLVKNNQVFRCGQAGICGSFGAAFSTITGNTVHDIYTERSFYGAEMAGIKFHGAIDALISGNVVYNSFIGIWLDWMTQGTRVTGNKLYKNDYVDFFPEVNHGPYYVEGNRFLSAFSLRDWSENGTYIRNEFAGLISRAPQDRATPAFKPHSTILVEVKPISGGGNLFEGNTFAGPEGKLPVRPKMHSMDQQDALLGYGLAIYEGAALPVTSRKNTFQGTAKPLPDTPKSAKH